jgi:hypothetical protein
MSNVLNSSLDDALDVELMFPGDRFPVTVGATLRRSGWRGGIFVQYATGTQTFTVEVSDGSNVAGFLLFQSENYTPLQPGGPGVASPENFIGKQFRSPTGGNNVATMINGGTRAYFRFFETVALTGGGVRTGGAITYSLNQPLRISENGKLCNDSEVNLQAAGVVTPVQVGIVSAVPATENGSRLCVDLKY